MKDLSIIVLSYNTKEITSQCLKSLIKNLSSSSIEFEILGVDNASGDGSIEMLKELESKNSEFKTILLNENYGYSKANNKAFEQSQGRYILFLNSDVIVKDIDFGNIVRYMDSNLKIGALTVRVDLQNGTIDPASHRGFPTLWRSLCYFSGMEKIFGKIPIMNKFIGGYHLLGSNMKVIHEIDSLSGAFFLTRKEIVKQLNGFDENFFMYGEDIDLSYRIKKMGYKILYYPLYFVLHLKYKSGLGNHDDAVRKRIHNNFYEAMKIFYKKHYDNKYPPFVNNFIYFLVDLKNKYL